MGFIRYLFFDALSGVVSGIRFTCYNGDKYDIGRIVGYGVEYTFDIGELISGDITIIGNGIGTRMGGIKFNTNKQNIQFPENWPSDRDNHIFPADSSSLLGFWGRADSDINALGLVLSPPIQSITPDPSLPATRVTVNLRRSENGEPEVKSASTDTEGDTSEDSTDNTEHNTLDNRAEEVDAITNDASQDTTTVEAPPTTPPPVTVPVWATALAATLSFLAGIALTLIVGIYLVRRAKSKTYVFGPDNTAPLVKSLLV